MNTNLEWASSASVARVAERYIGSLLPDGAHRSLPFPAGSDGQICYAFFFTHGRFTAGGEPYKIWAPRYTAYFEAKEGRFKRLQAIESARFGGPREGPIGSYYSPAERGADWYLSDLVGYYESLDLILPKFVAGVRSWEGSESSARTFNCLFQKLAESAFAPFYQVVGASFFAWLAQIDAPATRG